MCCYLLLLRLPLLLLLLLLVVLVVLLLHYVLLVGPARCFFFFFQLSCESYVVMDVVVQNPQKSSGYHQVTTMRKNMRVMTPRYAADAVVSAVVLRRPTKEYTHRYSMMHRRLTTANTVVAPHYHQLLVRTGSIVTSLSS